MAISKKPDVPEETTNGLSYPVPEGDRKRVVVVGLGMVGIAFM